MDAIGYGHIAREAAKVVLSRGRRRRGPRTVVIYAGGFRRTPKQRRDEISDYQASEWFPMNPDFRATARMTAYLNQTRRRARTVAEFFQILRREPGPIGRVVFIGHGSGTVLGFSGSISEYDPPRTRRNYVALRSVLNAAALTANAANLTRIRARLAEGATFDVVACGSIGTAAFLQTLANSFGMTVRGFNSPVNWDIKYNKRTHIITMRGEVQDEYKSRLAMKSVMVQGAHELTFTVKVDPQVAAPIP